MEQYFTLKKDLPNHEAGTVFITRNGFVDLGEAYPANFPDWFEETEPVEPDGVAQLNQTEMKPKKLKGKLFECNLFRYSDAAHKRMIIQEMDQIGGETFVVICDDKKTAEDFCQKRMDAKKGHWFINGIHENNCSKIFNIK